jgi:alginate O-acetyltransferase complex protein AlgI
MLFNSYAFIFAFLPITFLIFFGLSRFRLVKAALIWLTVASLFFYGYWDFANLPIMIVSIVLNHQLGERIATVKQGSKEAKITLAVGIILNLLIIGYYKYASFFLTSINVVIQTNLSFPKVVLPPGISFYTFTQMAYLVDAYRGETKGNKYDLVTYTLFISFFPQLIAGPILRHDELIPQFRQLKRFLFSQKNLALGLTTFSLGLAKKVLIADNLSPWVAAVFERADAVNFLEAWVGAISYTFQLYFDFSGYSDMAIGLGLMFNIYLPINFNSPYKAISIIDFWRRWHITLSNFLRDYLYIPLGGSRRGTIRRYVNLMTTMLLGGLWHGAGWTFVVWGGLHGAYLCVNHAWRKLNLSFPAWLGWTITFVAVVFSWVLFRATSFHDAMEMIAALTGIKGIVLPGNPQGKLSFLKELGWQIQGWKSFTYLPEINGSKNLSLLVLVALMVFVTRSPNTQEILQTIKPTWWWAMAVGIVTSFSLLSLNRVSEFLYFQF